MLIRIERILKTAFINFFRNGWLSVSATLIMTLALLAIGSFFIITLSTNKIVAELKGKVDIVVNFKDEATDALIGEFKSELLAKPNIQSVRYISKEDALREFKARTTVKREVRELVSPQDNPLPRGLQVQSVDFNEYEYVSALTKDPVYSPYIDSSSYEDNKLIIENIDNATKFIERFGIVLSIFFTAVAILVVFNTVKMAVTYKSKEIEIMRLVGASDSFVRIPFLIEGFLYGLFGLVISTLVIFVVINVAASLSSSTIFARFVARMVPIYYQDFWFITLLQAVVGTVIGIGSSWLSIRKNVKI
ncbi:MAG: permease-like cell division protein FtsX [Candidatus Berkelbacteria bacterium]|nr:permease-like cell division protein FtsX [Candidatus Berkelbacteria bacterium]